MEWRDSKGEVVPHSSKSYAQDGSGLFHVKMTLLLRNKSQDHVVCYIRNPLSGEGKQITLILNGKCLVRVSLSIKQHIEKINEIINVKKLLHYQALFECDSS